MEVEFRELERMFSSEILLDYPYWKILFTINTDAYDKQLSFFISQNYKPIGLFLIKLSKPQINYTTT